MTSILTNIASLNALQTLRSISGALADQQRQVSSGLRVQVAGDNAAYWSISTTMRSDRLAISAVSDALGLGAAKVDVAYAGMNAVVDVLHEFKAKLVAATEDGVDKAKIQTELEQFKKQVVGIAELSSFSGQNWLNTEVEDLHDGELKETGHEYAKIVAGRRRSRRSGPWKWILLLNPALRWKRHRSPPQAERYPSGGARTGPASRLSEAGHKLASRQKDEEI